MSPETNRSPEAFSDAGINDRFDRLDVKLDKLADALLTLVRVDEKVAAQQDHINHLCARMDAAEVKATKTILCLTKTNGRVSTNTKSVQTIYRGGVFVTCAFTLSAIGIFMAWLFEVPPVG